MKKLLILGAIGAAIWFATRGGGNAADAAAIPPLSAGVPVATTNDAAAPQEPALSAEAVAAIRQAELDASNALGAPATPAAPGSTDGDSRIASMTAARDRPAVVLKGDMPTETRRRVMAKLDELNAVLIFSPTPTSGSTTINVQPGDTLLDIGTRTGQGLGLLMKMNGLSSPQSLRAGATIKVLIGRSHIVVDKSQFTLSVYVGEQLIKQYLVGTGVNNCTPEGMFDIASKMREPVWRGVPNDDPRNPLGSRWMGFRGDYSQYGIHGTREPERIPSECSRGCIRMKNHDVEELIDFVTYRAQVEIKP